MKRIGHDGSEIIWPNLNDPFNRRGFHLSEIIYALWELGITVTPFDAAPVSASRFDSSLYVLPWSEDRILSVLLNSKGVLENPVHAVAWDGEKVYDPKGKIYDPNNGLDQFAFHIFYGVLKNESPSTNYSREATNLIQQIEGRGSDTTGSE